MLTIKTDTHTRFKRFKRTKRKSETLILRSWKNRCSVCRRRCCLPMDIPATSFTVCK